VTPTSVASSPVGVPPSSGLLAVTPTSGDSSLVDASTSFELVGEDEQATSTRKGTTRARARARVNLI